MSTYDAGDRMNEQPTDNVQLTLTAMQQAVIDCARRDLEAARAEDLARLPPAGLILTIERLRTRLDSVLEVIDEASQQRPGGSLHQ